MIRAFVFLRLCTLKNRVKSRLRRLRQPKYLIGGIVGALYFYGFVVRNMFAGRFGAGRQEFGPWADEGWRDGIESIGAWVLLLLTAGFWVVPSRRAAMEFTEAEIQFLFPAPVSRRGLLHYKLLSWQLGLLFTSLMVCLFSGRLGSGLAGGFAVLGWWFGLFLVQLHSLGASFTRSRLSEAGFSGSKRGALILVLLAVVIGSSVLWTWKTLPAFPTLEGFEPAVLLAWIQAVSSAGPLEWLLWPARCVVRLATTRELPIFLMTLPVVLLFIGLHYVWVVRGAMAFEEAAVEAARITAERLSANAGQPGRLARRRSGRRRPPFALRPTGIPWVALTWKNLIEAGAAFRGLPLVVLASVLVPVIVVGATLGREAMWPAVVGGFAALLLGMSVLVGPGILRCDLRQDLGPMAEVLKVQPLAGWQVVLGSMLAPWMILGSIQSILATVAVALMPDGPVAGGLDWRRRVLVWLTALLVVPSVTLVGLGLQNGAALLFPAWVQPAAGRNRGGLEGMGQQIVVFAGQFVGFSLALVPAGIVGAIVFVPLAWFAGPWWALVPAGLGVTATLLAESALAVRVLGMLWDRMDLSQEQSG